jgi:hypothetical protein
VHAVICSTCCCSRLPSDHQALAGCRETVAGPHTSPGRQVHWPLSWSSWCTLVWCIPHRSLVDCAISLQCAWRACKHCRICNTIDGCMTGMLQLSVCFRSLSCRAFKAPLGGAVHRCECGMPTLLLGVLPLPEVYLCSYAATKATLGNKRNAA